jgi:hypothetical protein
MSLSPSRHILGLCHNHFLPYPLQSATSCASAVSSMTTSVWQHMLLLMAIHSNIFCTSAVSTMTFSVWQHVRCYSWPYATAYMCFSSQQNGCQSVASCVVIHYSKFGASAVSSMTFRVWQHVHCYGHMLQHICASAVSRMDVRVVWSYTTENFVPKQSAV